MFALLFFTSDPFLALPFSQQLLSHRSTLVFHQFPFQPLLLLTFEPFLTLLFRPLEFGLLRALLLESLLPLLFLTRLMLQFRVFLLLFFQGGPPASHLRPESLVLTLGSARLATDRRPTP